MPEQSRTTLFTKLAALTEPEITSLMMMIEDPAERLQMLDFLRELRTHRRSAVNLPGLIKKSKKEFDLFGPIQPVIDEGATFSHDINDDGRDAFIRFFSNKDLFPETKDVVRAINAATGQKFRPDSSQRLGRTRFLNRVWETSLRLPSKRRRDFMNGLSSMFGSQWLGDADYQRLFRLLTRNEPNR